MLVFTSRANPILGDFVRQVYWARYAGGHTQINNDDARAFVERGIDDCKTVKRWSETTVLYYLSDVETIRGVEVLRTFEVKLEWEQQKHLVLTVAAATFTPVHYHTNSEGQLYGDCTHLPRVRFDRWSQELTRSSNGEFIKKKHRDKKMRSEVVSLDTKNPSKFWRSKMGVLAMFMSDVERHLSEYITINFHALGPEYRVRFKETDVKKTYQTISEFLTQKEINLINLTNADMLPLLNALKASSESGYTNF